MTPPDPPSDRSASTASTGRPSLPSCRLDRRTLLAHLATLAVAAGWPGLVGNAVHAQAKAAGTAAPTRDRFGELLPTRKFGRHDEHVTALCLGGSHYEHFRRGDPQAAADLAIEQGIRFIDTAESYGGGRSERMIGQYFVPKYRDVLFLMTKSKARTPGGLAEDLDGSRRRLNVEVLDLWQIHSLRGTRDVDRFVNGGGLDYMLEQRQRGTVRYLGMTGHVSPRPFHRLLDALETRGADFDAAQMPINLVDPHYESFGVGVLPRLVEKQYAVLAMKTLAFGGFFGQDNAWANRDTADPTRIIPDRVSITEALQFVLAPPIASLVSGMTRPEEIRENCRIVRDFAGMDPATRTRLVERCADVAGEAMEFYKNPTVE
jgi:aryl-alcohol dehydrogenase-like predicted oxidoreductase